MQFEAQPAPPTSPAATPVAGLLLDLLSLRTLWRCGAPD